jgi:hypothetical protein
MRVCMRVCADIDVRARTLIAILAVVSLPRLVPEGYTFHRPRTSGQRNRRMLFPGIKRLSLEGESGIGVKVKGGILG